VRLSDVAASHRALLEWYEPRRSAYPWRGTSDPYAVLVSEFMLQQTQASRVAPVFERFLSAFPSVLALSSAPLGDVIGAWAGLGYNRRAVALHRAATAIASEQGGVVPDRIDVLRMLPGIGAYTAAAVVSIAYGVPAAAIDTNVLRVVARMWRTADEAATRAAAERWLDRRDPGAWNQAVMDLGRTVCRPTPACPGCPLRSTCRSFGRAAPPGRSRPSEPFEGSARQVRGAVVGALRERRSATLGSLSDGVGRDVRAVAVAVRSLHADGLAVAGPAALAGRRAGRVALPQRAVPPDRPGTIALPFVRGPGQSGRVRGDRTRGGLT
jgi:A/G-specific adenine glycosylase